MKFSDRGIKEAEKALKEQKKRILKNPKPSNSKENLLLREYYKLKRLLKYGLY